MRTIAGVFTGHPKAKEAIEALVSLGIPKDRITAIYPGKSGIARMEHLSTTDSEQPGPPEAAFDFARVFGGIIGGSIGIAGGFTAAELIAVFLPGVGPVIGLGYLGAAVLGLAGADLGVKAGHRIDNATIDGLPADEIFVYEDALRKGRIVVLAIADDDRTAESVERALASAGAESIDAARQKWWVGLRSAEKEYYTDSGSNFDEDEYFYRKGFEAACHSRFRGREYDQVISELSADIEELQQQYPNADIEPPFRRGYMRGQAYYQNLQSKAA